MKQIIKKINISLLLFQNIISYAADLDNLFQNLIPRLFINTDTVLNLHAQFKNPQKTANYINEFDNFIFLSVKDNITYAINFDDHYNLITNNSYPEPWLGVAAFSPEELKFLLPFQDGYKNLDTCLETYGIDINNYKLKRFTIYQALQNKNMVYDFVASQDDSNLCQEFLYFPATKTCDLGMHVNCQFVFV